jgi:hypothetical protein
MSLHKGGMDYRCRTWVLLLAGAFVFSGVGDALVGKGEEHLTGSAGGHQLTRDQQAMVDFALDRFGTQDLRLPDLEFVFRDSLLPCNLHKGRYHRDIQLVEMCSMDKHTMLHEVAHAWANNNLTRGQMEAFVTEHGLDSWNDPDHAWARRGTEHVAETIAWAVSDEPRHVMWVEDLEDGTKVTTHKILTVDVDVEVLLADFKSLTGMEPVYRDASEWSGSERSTFSPEAPRG